MQNTGQVKALAKPYKKISDAVKLLLPPFGELHN